tara:strand:+ start:576 stop:863 length:288 start_codon:yes stop_codon:yes gene_type:complete
MTDKTTNRKNTLVKASALITGERASEYGDAYENHERIAKIWSVLLTKDITVEQVYQCMIAVKLSRLIETPNHEDSYVDICGYSALASEAIDKKNT